MATMLLMTHAQACKLNMGNKLVDTEIVANHSRVMHLAIISQLTVSF